MIFAQHWSKTAKSSGHCPFKVPKIPADILDDLSEVTLKIVVSLDEVIGKNKDFDPKFGVSDGDSFVGFKTVDKGTYASGLAPCMLWN